MPIILPPPIIYSNSIHHHNQNEGKQVLAFLVALHILPLIFITISFIRNIIIKDKYYDIFEENDIAWLSLLILFAADFLGLLTYFIYQII